MQRKLTLMFLLSGLWFINIPCHSQNIDSLLNSFYLSSGQQQKKQARTLLNLFNSQKVLDSIIVIPHNTHENVLFAKTYHAGAAYLYEQSEYDQSIAFAKKSMNYAKILKDTFLLYELNNLLCLAEQRLGNYSEAIKYTSQNLEMATRQNKNKELSTALHNMALLNLLNQEDTLALQLELRALEVEKKLNNPEKLAIRYGGLGEIYLSLKQHDKALEALRKALKIERQIGNEHKMAIRQSTMGDVFYDLKQKDSAIYYSTTAFKTFQRNNILPSTCICANQIGRIYVRNGENSKAIPYFKEALKISKQIGYKHMEQRACDYLCTIYENDNPASALQYAKRSSELKDSLYTEQNKEQINKFRFQYDSYQKEAEISLQKGKLMQQRILRNTLFIILILTVGIVVIFVRLSIVRKKRNQDLAQSNATKDKFFSIISHDLKSPAIAQKLSLEMLSKHCHELPPEDLKKQLLENYKSAETQVNLLQQLLEWRKMNLGAFQPEPTPFSIQTLLRETISLLEKTAKNKEISFLEDPADYLIFADRNMVATILRNLLSNAIKFSYRGREISITLEKEEKKLKISIIDHGVGMTQEAVRQIFNLSVRGQRGTEGETGTGLGLIICKKLVELNHGKLHITSNLDQEVTTVSFTLPLASGNKI